jgi:hypothetical protein
MIIQYTTSTGPVGSRPGLGFGPSDNSWWDGLFSSTIRKRIRLAESVTDGGLKGWGQEGGRLPPGNRAAVGPSPSSFRDAVRQQLARNRKSGNGQIAARRVQ